MSTTYTIVISIRALRGMRQIGNFFLGTEAAFAHSVFDKLKGEPTAKDDELIRIDLEKKDAGILPVRLRSLSCTLDQYAGNCKIITRDIFKFFTLEK